MNQKIKFIRQTLNLSERDISSFLNISSYKYTFLEKADVNISCDFLLLISRVYGIRMQLLTDIGYNNHDLLTELEKQDFLQINKESLLNKLKQNLLQNTADKITYNSIKRVKKSIQQKIIDSILSVIEENNMSVRDFSLMVNMDKENIEAILSKKRFIETEEFIKVTNLCKIDIDSIVNCR